MVTTKKDMAAPASLRLQWAGHNRISVILPALSRMAIQLLQLSDLVRERAVLPVCTAHSKSPWLTATGLLVARTSTTPNATQQMDSNRLCLPCLPTIKVSHIWHLAARLTRLTVCLHVSQHIRHRTLVILVVVTTAQALHHSFLTTQWRVLTCAAPSTPALAPSHQCLAQVERPPHLHHLERLCPSTSQHPHNSRSRYTPRPRLKSSLWLFL